MNRFIVTALAAVLVSACAPQEEKSDEAAGQMHEAVSSTTSEAPERDVTTAALLEIDPDIKEYDDNVQSALSAYEANANGETTTALVDAYLAFADYMTYESPVSPRQGKYHRALLEYRHAQELDPENEKAIVEIAQIEDIYRSMNRPIPGEE